MMQFQISTMMDCLEHNSIVYPPIVPSAFINLDSRSSSYHPTNVTSSSDAFSKQFLRAKAE